MNSSVREITNFFRIKYGIVNPPNDRIGTKVSVHEMNIVEAITTAVIKK
jgi:hypothetical protein